MTDKEKAVIMAYTGIAMLTGDKFEIFHKYVEEIMGRPVFTHEFATCAEEIKEKAKFDFLALCVEEDPERKRGEWIPFKWDDSYSTKIQLPKGSASHMEEYWDEEFICSVCGKAHRPRDFCPYCGSPMTEKALEILRKREGDQS